MQPSVASDLGLHCLPITVCGVSRLKWVIHVERSNSVNRENLPTDLGKGSGYQAGLGKTGKIAGLDRN